MTTRQTIAILGATGAQGGGLTHALLADPGLAARFAPRAITRTPDSGKARELARRGAEVVRADLDDAASLERAFEGAHGVFGVTNFWEHFSPERELAQARNLAEAARRAKVRHVLWSTLEDTRTWVPLEDTRMPTLLGKYKVPHFDAKGEANRFFEGLPVTFLLTSFYWENLIYFGVGPTRDPDGVLALHMPLEDKKMPCIAAMDIGACAAAVFRAGEELVGRTVGIAGAHLSGAAMASSLSRALGQEVLYRPVTHAAFRASGFPGAEDLGNMFQFKCELAEAYCARRDVAQTRALHPGLLDFDSWLERHKNAIPLR